MVQPCTAPTNNQIIIGPEGELNPGPPHESKPICEDALTIKPKGLNPDWTWLATDYIGPFPHIPSSLRFTNSFSQFPLPSDQLPRSIIKAWNNEVIQEWKNIRKTDYIATISSMSCLLTDSKYVDYVTHI